MPSGPCSASRKSSARTSGPRERRVARIAPQALEAEEREGRDARLVEGRDVARAGVLGAPLERVVREAAVGVLDRLEARRRPRCAARSSSASALERKGPGQAGQAPGALRRDALVEHGVAQVRARVQEARLAEGPLVVGREARAEREHELGQRVAARAAVDHVVGVVERVVAPGPERVAGARALAPQVGQEPPALLDGERGPVAAVAVGERQAREAGSRRRRSCRCARSGAPGRRSPRARRAGPPASRRCAAGARAAPPGWRRSCRRGYQVGLADEEARHLAQDRAGRAWHSARCARTFHDGTPP